MVTPGSTVAKCNRNSRPDEEIDRRIDAQLDAPTDMLVAGLNLAQLDAANSMPHSAHLFKLVKNNSLIRMFGKALSAKDEKVI